MENAEAKTLERGLRMSGDKANADLVRGLVDEIAVLREALVKVATRKEIAGERWQSEATRMALTAKVALGDFEE